MPYTFSLLLNIATLQDIQLKLNTPPAATLPELEGMFHRVHDFTRSHANLNEQLSQEYAWALDVLPRSADQHELMGNLPNEFNAWRVGKGLFASADLSPALRHFVNDSCRLLEPLTPLLARKFPDVPIGRRESLDSYIKKLRASGKALAFDDEFVVELYEIWNDYKHRETLGLQATPWKIENGTVVKAKLELPQLQIPIHKLTNMEVDDFANQASLKMLQTITFII